MYKVKRLSLKPQAFLFDAMPKILCPLCFPLIQSQKVIAKLFNAFSLIKVLNCLEGKYFLINCFPDLYTEQISYREILHVTQKTGLTRDQLHTLFQTLDLEDHEVENAERNADTRDVKLQAAKVLNYWRTTKGRAATKEAILEALEECEYLGAIEILMQQWNM